jgi:hypothetical protein
MRTYEYAEQQRGHVERKELHRLMILAFRAFPGKHGPRWVVVQFGQKARKGYNLGN